MASHANAESFDQRVGFVGLGNLGQPMALTLTEAGFDVTVFDLREEAMEPCLDAGASRAENVSELGSTTDVVGIAVRGDDTLKDVVLGADGLLDPMDGGDQLLIHSTVTPQTVMDIAEAADQKGVAVLDVAVSGGDVGALEGTLTLMIGGDEDEIERCRPLLDTIGEEEFHLGPSGRGVVGKLANNLMVQCNHLVALEAMKMASAYDVDEESIAALAEVSTGGSWIVENWGFYDRYLQEHTLSGTEELYFWMRSGCKHSLEAAEAKEITLPLTGLASELRPIMLRDRYEELTAAEGD
jgi:3-hydroxyisobutyrate dehydrogenase-like beta-hydroxyacid dehydrogenase